MEDVLQQEIDADNYPPPPEPNLKTQDVMYMVIDKSEICTAYTDLTGRFPCKSSSGKEYILVGYHYDANFILGTALKNRKKDSITTAWTHLRKEFARSRQCDFIRIH